ncbi:MAG: hypothetical protein ACE5J9_09250 [Methanosarcinales archaeon]
MSKVSFKYKERSSAIFEKVLRPLINLEIYSAIDGEWYIVENVLVDSGADLSLLPYRQGKLFILDIESGDEIEIRGIVPYSKLTVYLHRLKFRIDQMEFDAPVGISESDDVPPILG